MKRQLSVILFFIFIVSLYVSCAKLMPGGPAADEVLDGPLEGLTTEQKKRFLKGDAAFNDEVFSSGNGLGPLFVASSCATCHAGDGKGHPFTTLTRFGQRDSTGNRFLHLGGPQLQQRALPGFAGEQIPAGATFSKFTPPANTGLGFFEAVTDATLLALADENDADADGISGRPNWVHARPYSAIRNGSVIVNGKYIGRFGKKAAVYDLLQQTVNAYNQDMGINSSYEPFNTYDGQEADAEVSNQTVQDLVFYLQTLKVPLQRNQNDAAVIEGKNVFMNINCGKCHVPQLQTGPFPIEAISYKTFFPFTDLLLHDMGPGLDDGYTEGNALSSEWRTPALWGLGLSANSQGGGLFLMHDGRAKSIEEAILMHGGEAEQSKQGFKQLNNEKKIQLLKFLQSL